MDITLCHPSGEKEIFPTEENTSIDHLNQHLNQTYKHFTLLSLDIELPNPDIRFSELASNEITIKIPSVCEECESEDLTTSATRCAAKNGHLDCLRYLHENGCPWNEDATWGAAENGHMDCLKYLHENGCP